MIFNAKRIASTVAWCVVVGSCAFAGQNTKTAPITAKPAAQAAKASPFVAQRFEQAAISPDGKRAAWVEIRADAQGSPTGKKDIYVADSSGTGRPIRLTAGASAAQFDEGDVAWSPDSKRIAFLSDAAKSGQLQRYVSSAR